MKHLARRLLCVASNLFSRSTKLKVLISGILPRSSKDTRKRGKVNKINSLLRLECVSFTRRLYAEPDSDWVTNEKVLDMRFYYKDKLHSTEEGYKKLGKTINTALLNTVAKNFKQHSFPLSERFNSTFKVSPTKMSPNKLLVAA